MKANLEHLRREVIAYLEDRGLVVFKSYPRNPESSSDFIYWDTETYGDFREFVNAAEAVGAKLVTVYSREFSSDVLDEAIEHLNETSLNRDDRRRVESRLRDLRAYEGFVCEIELAFSHGGRTYVYDQVTPWYEEVTELLEEVEDAYEAPLDDAPLGGYYSNN